MDRKDGTVRCPRGEDVQSVHRQPKTVQFAVQTHRICPISIWHSHRKATEYRQAPVCILQPRISIDCVKIVCRRSQSPERLPSAPQATRCSSTTSPTGLPGKVKTLDLYYPPPLQQHPRSRALQLDLALAFRRPRSRVAGTMPGQAKRVEQSDLTQLAVDPIDPSIQWRLEVAAGADHLGRSVVAYLRRCRGRAGLGLW